MCIRDSHVSVHFSENRLNSKSPSVNTFPQSKQIMRRKLQADSPLSCMVILRVCCKKCNIPLLILILRQPIKQKLARFDSFIPFFAAGLKSGAFFFCCRCFREPHRIPIFTAHIFQTDSVTRPVRNRQRETGGAFPDIRYPSASAHLPLLK